MPILYANFHDLPFEQQLPLVWVEGTFLVRRWESGRVVLLYLMDGGFLCEVYLHRGDSSVQKVWPFVTSDTERLDPYACYVRLDDLMDA